MKKLDQLFFARGLESWEGIKTEELIGFFLPKCQKIISLEKLRYKITEHPKLKVKFGIDPTASEIHLGHVVPIMLLRQFIRAGHHIDLIIGDFTAQVGDPTAREVGRAPLGPDQIKQNMRTYKEQIGKYLDLNKIDILHNSQWLNSMTLQKIFTVFQEINLLEAIQREDFRARTLNNQAISLAEVCYGSLMGIDSAHLGSHIEVGGIDQLLNFQQCRKVMLRSGMEEEVTMMTPILEGISGDGRKMSKSYNNYIPINSTPRDKFGKIMSIPDRLIGLYFRCFSDVHQRELGNLDCFVQNNPLEAKKQLATLMVATETQALEDGLKEREFFERKFSQKNIRLDDCLKLAESPNVPIMDALMKSKKFRSRSELRRLFKQQSVRTLSKNGVSVLGPETTVEQVYDRVIRIGKYHLFHFIRKKEAPYDHL